MYDYLILIGRFQPFHRGHFNIVKNALEKSKNVILILGSHDRPRSPRNPFSTQERIDIISSCFKKEELDRIIFVPMYDYGYNDSQWLASVQSSVFGAIHRTFIAGPVKVGLIGHEKDGTSYYLNLFPQWDSVSVPNYKNLNSTDIRADLFENEILSDKLWTVNEAHFRAVFDAMSNSPQDFSRIIREYKVIRDYRKSWESAPYPPIFVTTDALVEQGGHVLLVKRKAMPGEGLYALPGGFLNQDEYITNGTIRELREETMLKVPEKVLRGSIVQTKVFDSPHRSERGRTITHCTHFRLHGDTLEKVKGADDAEKAFWFPVGDVKRNCNMFFEDHMDMIVNMLGI